jgi:hypothetical protein
MHVLPYLLMHAPLRSSLVSHPSILQAKRHSDIVVGSIRGDEQRLYLVRLIQRDLMVA